MDAAFVALDDKSGGGVPLPLIEEAHFKNFDKTTGKQFKNAITPNGKVKGKEAQIDLVYVVDPPMPGEDDWHTVHLRLLLSDGSRLGANLHSMLCEETPEAT